MSAKLAFTPPNNLPWDARACTLGNPPCSGTECLQRTCLAPTWCPPGEPGHSHWDCRVQSGSPWAHAGTSLLGQPEESVVPTWLLWHCWMAPRPTLCPGPWCLATLTATSHGDSGAVTQREGGTWGPWNLGAAQGSEVSWNLTFHTRHPCFNCWPGLGAVPVHGFCAPGL